MVFGSIILTGCVWLFSIIIIIRGFDVSEEEGSGTSKPFFKSEQLIFPIMHASTLLNHDLIPFSLNLASPYSQG